MNRRNAVALLVYNELIACGLNDTPFSATDVARKHNRTASTISNALKALENCELIERVEWLNSRQYRGVYVAVFDRVIPCGKMDFLRIEAAQSFALTEPSLQPLTFKVAP